jgi:hypothetical protein
MFKRYYKENETLCKFDSYDACERYGRVFWILRKNIDLIQRLYKSGKVKIILTTSRPEEMRSVTIEEMDRNGILYDQLIMGLPHCKRILINDFANTNQYPSCEVINILRNSDNLSDFITL